MNLFNYNFSIKCNTCGQSVTCMEEAQKHIKCFIPVKKSFIPIKKKFFKPLKTYIPTNNVKFSSKFFKNNNNKLKLLYKKITSSNSEQELIEYGKQLYDLRGNILDDSDINHYLNLIFEHKILFLSNKNCTKLVLNSSFTNIERKMQFLELLPINIDQILDLRDKVYKNLMKKNHIDKKLGNLISRPVLFYMNIEECIYKCLNNQNICFSPKIGDFAYYIFNEKNYFWELDNRLLNVSMLFHDALWEFSIPLFNELYYKVFKTYEVLDEDDNLYLSYDDIDGVNELRRMYINLMKCSSIIDVNNMFRNSIKVNQFDNINTRFDNNDDKQYYLYCKENLNNQRFEKLTILFQHYDLTQLDFKKLYELFLNY